MSHKTQGPKVPRREEGEDFNDWIDRANKGSSDMSFGTWGPWAAILISVIIFFAVKHH